MEQPAADPAPITPQSATDVGQADIDALVNAAGGDEPRAGGEPAAVTPIGQVPAPSDSSSNAEEALGQALDSVAAALTTQEIAEPGSSEVGTGLVDPQPFAFAELDKQGAAPIDAKRVSMLHDVNLRVKIELGRAWMLVEDVLRLGEQSVVELDKLAGDPVDVFVNDRLVARGEVLVLNDNFCVRIGEVLSNDPHRVCA